MPSDPIGEYVVQIGSDLTIGPIPMDKINEAHDLCHADTGANARTTVLLGDRQCPKCGVGWSETLIRPTRPSDNAADDLLLA
jgi:hypothetical protein